MAQKEIEFLEKRIKLLNEKLSAEKAKETPPTNPPANPPTNQPASAANSPASGDNQASLTKIADLEKKLKETSDQLEALKGENLNLTAEMEAIGGKRKGGTETTGGNVQTGGRDGDNAGSGKGKGGWKLFPWL